MQSSLSPLATFHFANPPGPRFIVLAELGRGGWSALPDLQRLWSDEGVVPIYLAGEAAAASSSVQEALRDPVVSGEAAIGAIYPDGSTRLDPLLDAIERHFGAAPMVARSRSGAPAAEPALLVDSGIAIDCPTVVDPPSRGRPRWRDDSRMVLELPRTEVFWGLLRRQGALLHPLIIRHPTLQAWFARLALLDRISLSPEGADVEQAICAIDMALDDGLPLLVFACHTPAPEGFAAFADWWQRVLAYCALRDLPNTSLAELMRAAER